MGKNYAVDILYCVLFALKKGKSCRDAQHFLGLCHDLAPPLDSYEDIAKIILVLRRVSLFCIIGPKFWLYSNKS